MKIKSILSTLLLTALVGCGGPDSVNVNTHGDKIDDHERRITLLEALGKLRDARLDLLEASDKEQDKRLDNLDDLVAALKAADTQAALDLADAIDGVDGEDGAKGDTGLSAFDIWLSEYCNEQTPNCASIENFLGDIAGKDGKDGKDGDEGPQGDPGSPGSPGSPGNSAGIAGIITILNTFCGEVNSCNITGAITTLLSTVSNLETRLETVENNYVSYTTLVTVLTTVLDNLDIDIEEEEEEDSRIGTLVELIGLLTTYGDSCTVAEATGGANITCGENGIPVFISDGTDGTNGTGSSGNVTLTSINGFNPGNCKEIGSGFSAKRPGESEQFHIYPNDDCSSHHISVVNYSHTFWKGNKMYYHKSPSSLGVMTVSAPN